MAIARAAAGHVELLPHDPAWAHRAEPVVDLMPVVRALNVLDALRERVESLGYEWCGESRLPGHRYCRRGDPVSGRRLVQVHAYAEEHGGIARHLAFRDVLRAHPDIAHDENRAKPCCQQPHPDDGRAGGACRSDGIRAVEARALRAIAVPSSTEPHHATH